MMTFIMVEAGADKVIGLTDLIATARTTGTVATIGTIDTACTVMTFTMSLTVIDHLAGILMAIDLGDMARETRTLEMVLTTDAVHMADMIRTTI